MLCVSLLSGVLMGIFNFYSYFETHCYYVITLFKGCMSYSFSSKKIIEKTLWPFILFLFLSNNQILYYILQSSLQFLQSIIQRKQIFTLVNNVSSIRNGNPIIINSMVT